MLQDAVVILHRAITSPCPSEVARLLTMLSVNQDHPEAAHCQPCLEFHDKF